MTIGIRNAVIGNFLPLSSHTDIGALWENYLVIERMKLMNNAGCYTKGYFWRTTQQQEIDYIEEQGQRLSAFEFKWSTGKKRVRFPKTFLNGYPETETTVITPADYDLFLTGECP